MPKQPIPKQRIRNGYFCERNGHWLCDSVAKVTDHHVLEVTYNAVPDIPFDDMTHEEKLIAQVRKCELKRCTSL
jgi:hypothetical protein